MDRTVLWVARVAWLLLPVTVGAAASRAGSDTSTAVHTVAAIELWALWAVGLVAALVPTTASLTVLRLLAPAPGWSRRRPRRTRTWLASRGGDEAVVAVVFRPASVGSSQARPTATRPATRSARPPLVLGPLPAVALHGRRGRGPLRWPPAGLRACRDAHRRARAGRAPRRFTCCRAGSVFVPAVGPPTTRLADRAFRWIEVGR